MMAALKRWFWPDTPSPIIEQPVTRHDVEPERLAPHKRREAHEAKAKLAGQLMSMDRKSYQVRQALAAGVLDIVAGNDR